LGVIFLLYAVTLRAYFEPITQWYGLLLLSIPALRLLLPCGCLISRPQTTLL